MCGTETGRRAGTLLQSCKQVRADCRQGADSRRPHKHTTKNGPSRLSRLRSTTHTPCVAAKHAACVVLPGLAVLGLWSTNKTTTTTQTQQHGMNCITHSSRHTTTKGNLRCHVTPNTMSQIRWGAQCAVACVHGMTGMATPQGSSCPQITSKTRPVPTEKEKRAGLLPAPGVQQFGNTAIAQTSALLIDGQELGGAVGLHQTIYPNQASIHTSHRMHQPSRL
jgi:hypothetical protein